jgi:hypothetical protein
VTATPLEDPGMTHEDKVNRLKETVGAVCGALIAISFAAVGIALIWWLSNVFYGWGLWPLGAITRVIAWLATAGAAVIVLLGFSLVKTAHLLDNRNE